MKIRTVLMIKGEVLGVIGLATSPEHSQVARLDLREGRPVSSEFDDPQRASIGFANMIRTSRRNGWEVVYDGQPLHG